MRLIDADALDDVIQMLNEKEWGISRSNYKMIDAVLFEFTTIDAVEVVLCKDCKWCRIYYHGANMPFSYECSKIYLSSIHSTSSCSFAERK